MKGNVLVFAGTTEGRAVCTYLAERGVPVTASVATEYGRVVLPRLENLSICAGRVDIDEMEAFVRPFDLVIDATHPYADAVTRNIRTGCARASVEVLRLRRPPLEAEGTVTVPDAASAAHYLEKMQGGILLTTGSKELGAFAAVPSVWSRCYVRVLPTAEAMESCMRLGLPAARVIGMQGPFSREMNVALLHQIGARYLVTKESGAAGGFAEKCAAAVEAGAVVVCIARPVDVPGLCMDEMKDRLDKRFHLRRKKVYLIGAGPGDPRLLTGRAAELLRGCRAVYASGERMATQVNALRTDVRTSPLSKLEQDIRQCGREDIAVLFSGDTVFHSMAEKLLPALRNHAAVEVVNGVSSLQYLCAKVGEGTEHIRIVSLHGRKVPFLGQVAYSSAVFFLTGGQIKAQDVCAHLAKNGLEFVRVTAGERLSLPEERICSGTALELAEKTFDDLTVLLVQNPSCTDPSVPLPDSAFTRGSVPMTKEEIRWVLVSKLGVRATDVVLDIGAGTGSVSVELARRARAGMVYAVERDADAVSLIKQNRKKHGAYNLQVVHGEAPACLKSLPVPDKAFIGGSGGNLCPVLEWLFECNPRVRVVLNCITLETLQEATEAMERMGITWKCAQINVAKTRKAGRYHMMTAQNPVFILDGFLQEQDAPADKMGERR